MHTIKCNLHLFFFLQIGQSGSTHHSLQGLSQKISLLVNIYRCHKATSAGICNTLPRLEFYEQEYLSYCEISVLLSFFLFSLPNASSPPSLSPAITKIQLDSLLRLGKRAKKEVEEKEEMGLFYYYFFPCKK